MDNIIGRSSFLEETSSLFTNEKTATARSKIVECLNESATANAATKGELITKIQELILHSDIELLDEFLENILAFSQDTNQEVRKKIAGFIEEICHARIQELPRVVNTLFLLLRDPAPLVSKRVIQGCSSIYRKSLQWICSLGDITDEVEQSWITLCLVKAQILDMIDHDNDGIRTNAIKFLESVVILQTYPDEDSMKRDNDFSLEDIPLTLKIARRRKLEDEAINIFELLLQFHGASHISSVNLIACTGTLCIVAKMRPSMMNPVIEALKNLHANLPPTLTNSQVSSVRKNLKMQFINLLKHPATYEHQASIAQILIDLGASNSEIARAIPKVDKREQQRRAKRALESVSVSAKRVKMDEQSKKEKSQQAATGPRQMEVDYDEISEQKSKANKINETFVTEQLQKIETVTQLVMVSMSKLPSELPETFPQHYTPVSNISLTQQIQKIAQLLGQQMTELKVGPGTSAISKEPPMKLKISDEEEKNIILSMRKDKKGLFDDEIDDEDEDDFVEKSTAMEVDEKVTEDEKKKKEATRKLRETLERVKGEQSEPKLKQRIKTLKLQEVTKQLSKEVKSAFLLEAIKRILKAEKQALIGGVAFKRRRILTVCGSTFMPAVRSAILEFILEDIVKQLDLAFAWIFEEYSLFQGFTRHTYIKSELRPDHAYSQLLTKLLNNVIDRREFREKESLLKRFFLEAPLVPDDAIKILVDMCELEELSECGMQITKDLLIRRPPKEKVYLGVLLRYSVFENQVIRAKAIENITCIYSLHKILITEVENHAKLWLNYLTQETPSEDIFKEELGRLEMQRVWNDDLIKVCLGVFLEILPINQELFHNLTQVYVKATSDVKRLVLGAIEGPVRNMGSDSEQLLKLIEQCPKGSETLITKIIYILTEKKIPTPELVEKVRNLHKTRVSDVRLLVPVINGLTKKEILAALPKLIKLNPIVVKEVFKRLLGVGAEVENLNLPLSAVDLLVALHTMDTAKVDIKCIVKATSLCLTEKDTYTQDVMALVLQQLMEMTPLPTLLMRTVIQSLSIHPRLSGFVTNLLQRLIMKQVWKQKVVWEGFLKCCQRLQPQSLGILIQLPAQQLQDALNINPDFREPMLEHAREIMEHQIGHVSQQIMDVLLGISPYSVENCELQVVGNYVEDAPMGTSHGPIVIKQEKGDEGLLIPEPAPPGMD